MNNLCIRSAERLGWVRIETGDTLVLKRATAVINKDLRLILLNGNHPALVSILIPPPTVLEPGVFGIAVRGGMKIPALVERAGKA